MKTLCKLLCESETFTLHILYSNGMTISMWHIDSTWRNRDNDTATVGAIISSILGSVEWALQQLNFIIFPEELYQTPASVFSLVTTDWPWDIAVSAQIVSWCRPFVSRESSSVLYNTNSQQTRRHYDKPFTQIIHFLARKLSCLFSSISRILIQDGGNASQSEAQTVGTTRHVASSVVAKGIVPTGNKNAWWETDASIPQYSLSMA